MKAYQHLSFRLELKNPRDKKVKVKLKELKKQYNVSYNELLKLGIEAICLFPTR